MIEPKPIGRPILLLVEDNRDDEAVSIRAIESAGIQVEIAIARDGVEAVAALGLGGKDSPAAIPDLVLLDLKIPKLSGIAVLRLMREDSEVQNAPVVVLTSSDEPTDIEECEQLGAKRYVQKAVDYRLYMQEVGNIVREFIGDNP